MKKYRFIHIGLLLYAMTACEFDDTNIDPTNPSPESIVNDGILPAAEAQTLFNVGALGGRMPGIVMQHFAGFDAQQVAYTSYVIEESDLNNLWTTGLYAGSMKDHVVMIENAEESGNNFYLGVAKILLAHNLGLATNFWGDVPYTEAFGGREELTPAYDSQEQVFATIQTLLDEAITSLSGEEAPVKGGDLIFGGDESLWIKTARALKARYALQLTKRTGEQAASQALAFINEGTIESDAETPYFTFDAAAIGSNPYAQFGAQRPKTMIIAPSFVNLLDANSDPRKEVYMIEDGTEFLFYNGPSSDLFWSQNDSPLPLISYTEVKFIEAEALVRTGSNGLAVYQDAVRASMNQLSIPEDEAAAYIAGATSRYNAAGDKIQAIINEKYVALFAQAETEIWSDYRRTGYPNITPARGGSNGVNPSGVVPVRFLYPIGERQFNNENREAAIAQQGGHLLDDPLWAYE